jgi:hypothetical protein
MRFVLFDMIASDSREDFKQQRVRGSKPSLLRPWNSRWLVGEELKLRNSKLRNRGCVAKARDLRLLNEATTQSPRYLSQLCPIIGNFYFISV